tara:strand:- start:9388 stop:9792 length:405 start_codon:yes stop_codon:yes gene_type:complete
MELKDWLKSINFTKNNLIDEDPTLEKDYSPFIINKCLSGNLDAIMFVNEINQYHFLPKKMQYDFYVNALRKSKNRYAPWLNKEQIENIQYIKKYYGYNNEKARQVLKILTKKQINKIKSMYNTGGNNESNYENI